MFLPMLVSLADAPLEDPQLVYEPKYDGIRAIAEIREPASSTSKGSRPCVRLWSRLGHEKTAQFPEIAAALEKWAERLKQPVVFDGEIVALNATGEPAGFQQLQGRIHLGGGWGSSDYRDPHPPSSRPSSRARVAFIAFDVLREGRTDLRDHPLLERRAALERIFGRTGSPLLRISEMVSGDGRALYKRALSRGWEGLIAKRAQSRYMSGKRTPDWRKLKIVREQEFVVGGWTEPRQTRAYFGALLLGVYEDRQSPRPSLAYVGHTGTGFNDRELARVMKQLKPLETRECPFREQPHTNERPHWVQPELVAQIKFTEWTADGKLRHPVYLGLRDDKKPEAVHRESKTRLHATTTLRLGKVRPKPDRGTSELIDQLQAIESTRREGMLALPDSDRLNVGNLHKVFWPKQKLTKGDLMRYYMRVAPFILPAVDGRPLVMKRFPNGITGQSFYQQRAPDEVPAGVRVEVIGELAERGPGGRRGARPEGKGSRSDEVPSRLVGGNLKTLLYMTQLANISQDPWFSRVQTPGFADHAALDLDPMPGVSFGRVLDVARWIRDELQSLGATGVPKTSGADGLHIYVPLPPDTPYEAGLLFCQIVATVVADKHPKEATIERAVRTRGKRVYVDYLQNILGKTLATAYSARASDYAGVSTPLTWEEIDQGVVREDFTIETVPARLRAVGDLWAALRRAKGVDFSRVARYAERSGGGPLKGDNR